MNRILIFLFSAFTSAVFAQIEFVEMDSSYSAAYQGINSPELVKGSGFKKYVRWKYFSEARLNPDGTYPDPALIKAYYQDYNESKADRTTRAAIANWTSVGPTYYSTGTLTSYAPGIGRVDVVCFHPDNDNIIFVGTPTGGLWKSIDGGSNWYCLTDAQGLTMWGVADLVFDPTDPEHMFMAAGDGDTPTFIMSITSTGLYETFDGGETWNETAFSIYVASGAWISRIMMHPTDGTIMYVSGSFGIYKTTDGFETGTIITSIPDIMDMEVKPDSFNDIYACTNHFTYKINASTLAVTTLISHPSGFRSNLGVSIANPDYLYVCVAGTGALVNVFKSTDAGVSFTTLPYDPAILLLDFPIPSYVGTNTFDLNVSPTNAEEVYVGCGNLYRFLEGDWTKITTSIITNLDEEYVHGDVHTLEFNADGKLYVGTDGGLFEKGIETDVFTDISAGMSISQIYKFGSHPTDPLRFNIGTQDNGQMEYRMGGNWEQITGSDGWHAYYHPTDPDIFYTSILFGHVYKTIDGGETVSLILDPNDVTIPWGPYIASYRFISPFLMHPLEPEILYAAYDDVYRSDNGGASWSKRTSLNKDFHVFAAAYSNPDSYYFGTRSELYLTTSNGDSYSLVTPPIAGATLSDIIVDPLNYERVWLSLAGYVDGAKVFYSADAGSSWTNISGDLPNFPVNCLHFLEGSNDEIYLGNDAGVYVMNDTLAWQNFSTDLPTIMVYDLSIDYENEQLRAGTFGRGVWVSDLFSSRDVAGNKTEESIKPMDLLIYPNPATDRITMRAQQDLNALEIGVLVDASGKIVARFDTAELATGSLDISFVAPGNYILKLATNSARYTFPILIVD